jgi:hypothetical protein
LAFIPAVRVAGEPEAATGDSGSRCPFASAQEKSYFGVRLHFADGGTVCTIKKVPPCHRPGNRVVMPCYLDNGGTQIPNFPLGGPLLERAFPSFADDLTWWVKAAKMQINARNRHIDRPLWP